MTITISSQSKKSTIQVTIVIIQTWSNHLDSKSSHLEALKSRSRRIYIPESISLQKVGLNTRSQMNLWRKKRPHLSKETGRSINLHHSQSPNNYHKIIYSHSSRNRSHKPLYTSTDIKNWNLRKTRRDSFEKASKCHRRWFRDP